MEGRETFIRAARIRKAEVERELGPVMSLVRELRQLDQLIQEFEWQQALNTLFKAPPQEQLPLEQPEPQSGSPPEPKNKSELVVMWAKHILGANAQAEMRFGEIYRALPQDVRIIYGKHSKEGIRSILKRAGPKAGIVQTVTGGYRLFPATEAEKREAAG